MHFHHQKWQRYQLHQKNNTSNRTNVYSTSDTTQLPQASDVIPTPPTPNVSHGSSQLVSLDGVSDEEINMLCQNLIDHEDYQSVARLILTNRRIHAICQPFLTHLKRQLRPCHYHVIDPTTTMDTLPLITFFVPDHVPTKAYDQYLKVHPTPAEFEQFISQHPTYQINSTDPVHGNSNLDDLLSYGNYQLIEYLVHRYGHQLLNQCSTRQTTPLINYVEVRDYEMVKRLLDWGADVNCVNTQTSYFEDNKICPPGVTALNVAIRNSARAPVNLEIVRLLIEHDAILGPIPVTKKQQQMLNDCGYHNP